MLVVPSAPVTEVLPASVPVPAVRDQLTVTPPTPLPNLSATFATKGAASVFFTVSCCPLPDTTEMILGSDAVTVAGMLTLSVPVDAVKFCAPAIVPSVREVDAAPALSVVAEAVPTLPPVGAEKLTFTPAIATPSDAVTRTVAGSCNAVPAFPVWPPPLTTTMFAGGSVTPTVALSVSDVTLVATTLTTPRFPVVVRTPAALIVAIVGSETVHAIG